MVNCKREITYRCNNDCRIAGCPSHKGILEFQSCSNAYHFNMNGRDLFFEEGELQAMIDLIRSLNRVDCVKLTRVEDTNKEIQNDKKKNRERLDY